MRYADLHLHTTHSDGTRSAREVIDLAVANRIEIVAISDHDNVAAFAQIRDYASEREVVLVPATELSAEYRGIDVHLLAYAFDPSNVEVLETLSQFRDARLRRGIRMVEQLSEAGIALSIDRVRELAGEGSMGRPHVARALVEAGRVPTIDAAFRKFLTPGRPGFVAKRRFSVTEAVALIHEAGGVLSIAHPTLYPDFQSVTRDVLALGVDAVEVIHPQIPADSERTLRLIARERGAFVTGGSDDHGTAKAKETIGTVRIAEEEIGPILGRLGK